MKKVSKDSVIYKMCGQNNPVLRIEAGEILQFETQDAFGGQIQKPEDFVGLNWDNINPATGPVYVNGAEVGDVLSVKIDKIEVGEQGVILCGKGMGSLGHILEKNTVKIVSISNDKVQFSDKLQLDLNKMVGVIGTAPEGDAIPCGAPDFHGGNMDCKEVREGATLFLPVNVPGALLAMGDLHAVMADGEIGVTGVEVSGLITVTVDVIKDKKLPTPMIENDSHIMTLASHVDLDIAVDMAVENMVKYLTEFKDFSIENAVMLTSLVGDVRICQVVDPKKTIRVEMPKKVLV